MARRIKYKMGDVFKVPLLEEKLFGVGRILKSNLSTNL